VNEVIKEETSVKRRIAIASAMAATLLAAAACSTSKGDGGTDANKPVDGSGKTIKVWLMVDAQTGWKSVVDDATARFKAATKADVQVEYQQWTGHLAKLDTALAGSDTPDVVELGNTEMPKYVNSAAFTKVNKGDFENSGQWLPGLAGACDLDGATYCVPYYAGARVLIYRKDLFEKSQLTPPTSYDEFLKATEKLQADNSKEPKFGAFYIPTNWFMAMSWAQADGGKIAVKQGGKWAGQLSQPAAKAGIQKWVDLVHKYSKADPSKDENDQALIFAQGNSAMFYGNGWERGSAEETLQDPNDKNSPKVKTAVAGKLATAPMPGIPSFLGGSNLGVTEKSKNKELAAQWVKFFTDSTAMKGLIAAKALPNATNLLDEAAKDPDMTATANAAKSSWFTPNSDKWADVEKATVPQTMLRDILKGSKTVDQATAWADEQINTILNAS
jgi:N,N'-diacetylchitobiose transport system substrate-binding protein